MKDIQTLNLETHFLIELAERLKRPNGAFSQASQFGYDRSVFAVMLAGNTVKNLFVIAGCFTADPMDFQANRRYRCANRLAVSAGGFQPYRKALAKFFEQLLQLGQPKDKAITDH